MSSAGQHKGSAGFLPNDRIGPMPKTIDAALIARFRKLNDITGTISDFLDVKGIRGTVSASRLKPTMTDRTIVGRAITVRNIPQPFDPHAAVTVNDNLMSEVEGIHQAEPGDVLVIQGLEDISNMGGIMATTALHQKLSGAVVDGGVRDVGHSRRLGFPIWSKDISPITGKWRLRDAGDQRAGWPSPGCRLHPGDLVVADETGVCFVPHALIEDVLTLCEAADAKEADWVRKLEAGLSVPDLVKSIYQNFPYKSST